MYLIQRVQVIAFQPEGISDTALQRANPRQFVFNRWRRERIIDEPQHSSALKLIKIIWVFISSESPDGRVERVPVPLTNRFITLVC
jgi:hypothetical protein